MKISALPVGFALSRFCKALIMCNGDVASAADYVERQSWQETPEVGLVLRSLSDPLDSTSSLAFSRYGLLSEFLQLINKVSAFEQLKSRFFGTAFRIKTPFEDTAPVGDFVGEAGAIPVRSAVFGSVILEQNKIGNIIVVTTELARSSSPATALAIPRMMVNENGFTTDKKFFDALPAVPLRRPAGITSSGAGSVTSTGSTAAAIATDLASMIAALTTPWRDVVFVMKRSTFAAIAARIPTSISYVGAKPMLLGVEVVFSLGIGAQIVLLDAASIIYADGNVEVDASKEALLEMSNTPISGNESPLTGTTTLKSLFQNGLHAFKVERFVSWHRSADAAVVSMAVTY